MTADFLFVSSMRKQGATHNTLAVWACSSISGSPQYSPRFPSLFLRRDGSFGLDLHARGSVVAVCMKWCFTCLETCPLATCKAIWSTNRLDSIVSRHASVSIKKKKSYVSLHVLGHFLQVQTDSQGLPGCTCSMYASPRFTHVGI